MTDEFEHRGSADAPASGEREHSFLRRWSRRKSQVQARDPDRTAQDADVAAAGEAESARVEDPRAQPTDADMPPVESLGEGSDYRGFLSSRVSASLRRAALRKLFQSPRFNVRDGLDDYDGDYTRYTPLHDDTQTAHAKFQAARLRERLRPGAAEDATVAEPATPDAEGEDPGGRGHNTRGESSEQDTRPCDKPA